MFQSNTGGVQVHQAMAGCNVPGYNHSIKHIWVKIHVNYTDMSFAKCSRYENIAHSTHVLELESATHRYNIMFLRQSCQLQTKQMTTLLRDGDVSKHAAVVT